jgi:hypothetical protein
LKDPADVEWPVALAAQGCASMASSSTGKATEPKSTGFTAPNASFHAQHLWRHLGSLVSSRRRLAEPGRTQRFIPGDPSTERVDITQPIFGFGIPHASCLADKVQGLCSVSCDYSRATQIAEPRSR